MSESSKKREQAAKLHPNKTGFTEAQGFCSCGQFQIAFEGICRRCSRELDMVEEEKKAAAEKEKAEAAAEKEKKAAEEKKEKTNCLSLADTIEYNKHLGEASDVIKDLISANEKLLNNTSTLNTQAIRIENARNRAAEVNQRQKKPLKERENPSKTSKTSKPTSTKGK